jgi:catalase-peroxidase
MDAKTDDKSAGKCPVLHSGGRLNRDWWPNQLNIRVLHHNSPKSDPMGERSTTPRNSRASTSTP